MKVKLEYIWLDGYEPEPNLRSKVKVIESPIHRSGGKKVEMVMLQDCPDWSFDGSSTHQAEGSFSDCVLKPVRLYPNPLNRGVIPSYFVLCEVFLPDGTPHPSNTRSLIGEEEEDLWFGFEQEYTLVKDGRPLGFPTNGYPEPQGKYYCGVGNGQVNGRTFVDEHMEMCILAGIDITGTNAEVMLGQWEYQVGTVDAIDGADQLWVSRYILHRLSEKYNYRIELDPKPFEGERWNGSGMHVNFSTKTIREDKENKKEIAIEMCEKLAKRHAEHIAVYGENNEARLTGANETSSIEDFGWGIADRTKSIRIPSTINEADAIGYIEDRRPASNADPYLVVERMVRTLLVEEFVEC